MRQRLVVGSDRQRMPSATNTADRLATGSGFGLRRLARRPVNSGTDSVAGITLVAFRFGTCWSAAQADVESAGGLG
jgi:hypothetical protein